MAGSLDGGRAFNCLSDQSVEESARDLEGFSHPTEGRTVIWMKDDDFVPSFFIQMKGMIIPG